MTTFLPLDLLQGLGQDAFHPLHAFYGRFVINVRGFSISLHFAISDGCGRSEKEPHRIDEGIRPPRKLTTWHHDAAGHLQHFEVLAGLEIPQYNERSPAAAVVLQLGE